MPTPPKVHDSLEGLFPPDTVAGDPARREAAVKEIERIIGVTLELAFITKAIPGRVGRIFAPAIAGVEKTPGGQVSISSGTTTNFAPTPVGFADPTKYGGKRNWWIPAGAGELIPAELDRFNLGIAEQRAEDQVAASQKRLSEINYQIRAAKFIVEREADDTLRDIVEGNIKLNRAAVVVAGVNDRVGLQALKGAAFHELQRRQIKPEQGPTIAFVPDKPAEQLSPVANQEPEPPAKAPAAKVLMPPMWNADP